MQQMRLRMIRRLPIAFGWLTKRGDAATARWIRPVLTKPEIRRDTVRVLRAIRAGPNLLVEAAERLPKFEGSGPRGVGRRRPGDAARARPAPRRIAPAGRLVEVDDSYTLIPLDQPARLAALIREFASDADVGLYRSEFRCG